jgi:hypothetical protein
VVLNDKDKYLQVTWVLIIPGHWKDQILKQKYRQSYTVCFCQVHVTTVVQACTTLFVVQAISVKFSLHVVGMKVKNE